jgi:regulator of RNase E activity RraA
MCRSISGDIIVGDAEGVVVVPRSMADEVALEAAEQTLFEDFVQERVMAGQTIFGLYPPAPAAREAFRKWRAGRQK